MLPGHEYDSSKSRARFLIPDFPPGSLRVTINEVTDQGRNVFFSFAQWRKRNRKNIEPIKKVASPDGNTRASDPLRIWGGPYVGAAEFVFSEQD
jgi:hypothetical protein